MKELTRRRFVQGAAGGVGLLTVGGGLRYLEHVGKAEAGEVLGKEEVFRTGHSNNCDGACGHQVKVVDGRIRLVTSAAFTAKTIDGKTAPKFDPRICLRGVAQIQNTYSPDRDQVPVQAGRRARLGPLAAHQLGRGDDDDRRQVQGDPGEVRQEVGLDRAVHRLALDPRGRRRRRVPLRERDRRRRPATSRATTRATARRPPAGTTCSPIPDATAGGDLRRPRDDRLPQLEGDRALGEQRRRDVDPGLADRRRRAEAGHHGRLDRSALHADVGEVRCLAADPARAPTQP